MAFLSVTCPDNFLHSGKPQQACYQQDIPSLTMFMRDLGAQVGFKSKYTDLLSTISVFLRYP